MDAGRALLLEYMSALGGNPEAAMGMGYRYIQGFSISFPASIISKYHCTFSSISFA
jgi:hypothetical protein